MGHKLASGFRYAYVGFGFCRKANDLDQVRRPRRFLGRRQLPGWLESYVEGIETPEVPREPAAFDSPESHSDESEPEKPEVATKEEKPEIEQQRCTVCDSLVDDSDEYCETCGTALSQECPICRCQVGDEPYCRECGTKLTEECDVCGYRRHESEQYFPRCGTEF